MLSRTKNAVGRWGHAARARIDRMMGKSPAPERTERRVCHYNQLYVTSRGDIFPCCLRWPDRKMRIANVRDPDYAEKIAGFYHPCSCDRYTLQKPSRADRIAIHELNVELSLRCQADCAMCSVDAPSFEGTYDGYDGLTRLVERFRPKEVLVQGGEVLVQRASLQWIEGIKRDHGTRFSIVTNASVPVAMADRVESLFDTVKVSFVGFQPETYRRVMGLDMARAVELVEKLNEHKRVVLSLKYLVTPLNLHEAPLFLRWAIGLKPNGPVFFESASFDYMNFDTSDRYWAKICERTGAEIAKVIADAAPALREHRISVQLSPPVLELYRLDRSFDGLRKGLEEWVSVYMPFGGP